MKKMKNLGFLLLFLCTSVFSYGQEIIKIKIKENTVPCTGVAPMVMVSLACAVNENDAAVNAAKPKSDLILFIILFSFICYYKYYTNNYS